MINSKKEIIKILQEDPLQIIKRSYSEAIDETVNYSKEKLIKDLKRENLGSKKVFVVGWGKSVDEFVKTVFGCGGGKRGAGAASVVLPALFKNLPPEIQGNLAKAIGEAITHKALQIAGDGVRDSKETEQ